MIVVYETMSRARVREKGTHLDTKQHVGAVCRRSGRPAALLHRRSVAQGPLLPIRPAVRPSDPESPQEVAPPRFALVGGERPHELLGLLGVGDAPGGHDAPDLDQSPGPYLADLLAQAGLVGLLSRAPLLGRRSAASSGLRHDPIVARRSGEPDGARDGRTSVRRTYTLLRLRLRNGAPCRGLEDAG